MTNYVKSTNFTSKDSLATGNPLKIVKGTEIDAEFNNIATAVNTKSDLLNPTFTGIPAAPTAAYGTNTTQLATTAFVTAALQLIYPVGSIYTNASSATNPATLIGFGTWTAFGTGRVLVGINGADSSFDVLGETGGSKDSVVVSHNHAASVNDPGHTHTSNAQQYNNGHQLAGGDAQTVFPTSAVIDSGTTGISVTNSATGVSGTNANMQPYVVVNMWRRTA
jgi:hypothetical protein